MSDREEDERDVYFIPQNFVDTGKIMGGMLKLRNAVEANVLVMVSALPIILYVPANLTMKAVLLCMIPLPLGLLGLIGIGENSLTEWLVNALLFLKIDVCSINTRTLVREIRNERLEEQKEKRSDVKQKPGLIIRNLTRGK